MASIESKTFSPALKSFINSALNGSFISVDQDAVSSEIQGFLHERPVVLLQNGDTKISYLRPGVDRTIQQAFIKLRHPIDIPDQPFVRSGADFTDLSKPPAVSKNPKDLKQLFEICKKLKLLKELYLEIVEHDIDYFEQSIEPKNPRLSFSPLALSECTCRDNSNNRLFTDIRYIAERRLVSHIATTLPNKRDQVRVISMGSGKLLQDWKAIGLLVKEGYCNISWTAVDPINENNSAITQVRDFFKELPFAEITLSTFTSIDLVPADTLYHAVFALDIPAIWEDLIKSFGYLGTDGKLIYGRSELLFEVSSQETLMPLYPVEYEADLVCALEAGYKEPLHIVSSSSWDLTAALLTKLSKKGISKFLLSLPEESENKIALKSLFSFLFPSLDITIQEPTEAEMDPSLPIIYFT